MQIASRSRTVVALVIAAAVGIGAALPVAASAENTLEIVIAGGPHTATYRPPASEVSCLYFKTQKQLNAVYKDFGATGGKKLGEAGINILNPDDPGPKRGNVLVAFGSSDDKSATSYSISLPEPGATLTLTRNGAAAEMTFQGRTKDGVSIRMTAKCAAVEEM